MEINIDSDMGKRYNKPGKVKEDIRKIEHRFAEQYVPTSYSFNPFMIV